MPGWFEANAPAGAPAAQGQQERTWGDTALDALPAIGGAAGGIAGGIGGSVFGVGVGGVPGAVGGAALGGAAGESAKQLIGRLVGRDTPDTAMGAAQQIGMQGGLQGLSQAAGAGVGKGLELAGRGAYGLGAALIPRTIKDEFPKIAEAGFREGVALTKGGVQKAGTLIKAGSKAIDDRLASAQGALGRLGAPQVQTSEVLKKLGPVRETLKKRSALGLPDEAPALRERALSFRTQNGPDIPLTKAQGLKREAQDMADTAYRAQRLGNPIKDDQMLGNRAIASGLREQIEQRVPAVGPMNVRLQELIGLREAAEHASGQSHILSRLGGAAVGGMGGMTPAAAGLMATTPQGLTSLGLGMKAIAPAASHVTPQAARLALLALLEGDGGQ